MTLGRGRKYLWFSEARVIAQHIRKLKVEGPGLAPDSTELEELQGSLQALFNSMIPVRHLLPVISEFRKKVRRVEPGRKLMYHPLLSDRHQACRSRDCRTS